MIRWDAGITPLGFIRMGAQPDGGTARQSQRVCAPQTISTGFIQNDGRLDDNTASSACTSKELGRLREGSLDVSLRLDFLNTSLLPIDLGDIFQKTVENVADRRHFILLAQPCDLMVRTKTGSRKGVVERVIMAPVKIDPPSTRQSAYFTLPHFHSTIDKPAYVDFNDTQLVSLNILDLCAFNSSGEARIGLSDKCNHLVLAWRKHHAAILKFYGRLIENRTLIEESIASFNEGKEDNEKIPTTIVDSLSPDSSTAPLFSPEVDAKKEIVTFDCKRVGRFEFNRAAAMWTKYCNFLARAAFDLDLGT